jgi:hypothetical protein
MTTRTLNSEFLENIQIVLIRKWLYNIDGYRLYTKKAGALGEASCITNLPK